MSRHFKLRCRSSRRLPTTLPLYYPEAPVNNVNNPNRLGGDDPFRVVSDILSPGVGRSIVSLQPEPEAEQQLDDQLNSGPADPERHIITADEQPGPQEPEQPSSPAAPVADMDIPEGALADDELPAPEELPGHIVAAKKRGRPPANSTKTPAKAKTPQAAATTNGHAAGSRATSGRKRKAEDEELADEATPVKRPRGRPPRSTAATTSARLAAKDAKKGKPGRPKGSGTVSLAWFHMENSSTRTGLTDTVHRHQKQLPTRSAADPRVPPRRTLHLTAK